tara:strand:- start:3976 stop:4704 length:729 start_codon:yes stop_codon:yes gene_type:complete
MKKHIVLVKARNIEKFNYAKFGNYKDVKGKNRILIDPNGEEVSGYEMFNAVKSLDINDEDDKRIYEFLKDHPLIKGGSKFVIQDMRAEQEKAAEDSIESAKAITTASQLNINELKNLSLLMGLSPNLDDMMLKAKIIQFASDNATKFLATLNDVDKEHRVFLKQALDKQALTKVNGVWKHGSNNIGLTDDQAIVWLKENADVYAMIKHQMRTGKATPIEQKEEKIEVSTNSSTPQGLKELME